MSDDPTAPAPPAPWRVREEALPLSRKTWALHVAFGPYLAELSPAGSASDPERPVSWFAAGHFHPHVGHGRAATVEAGAAEALDALEADLVRRLGEVREAKRALRVAALKGINPHG